MSNTDTPQSLSAKIILITGASDGFGRAAALAYAKAGATVILAAKDQAKLNAVYDEIEAAGGAQAAVMPIDFEKAGPDDYKNMLALIDQEFGHLDGLLINAAWLGATTSLPQYDVEIWYKVMQINLHAAFLISQALLPLLNKSSAASIVFNLDEKNTAYWGAYGVSKAALESYMMILADELDSDNNPIRVNGIKPEKTRTKLRMRAYPGEDPNLLPLPEEMIEPFVYLMSDESRGLHGEILPATTVKTNK